MSKSVFEVSIRITNPGHFFACCGLLELAGRLWPSAEAWFDIITSRFLLSAESDDASFESLVEKVVHCPISGLTAQERSERQELERRRKDLSDSEEKRRKVLGEQARKGSVQLEAPFNILLNWWHSDDDDDPAPKTWAGRQEIHRVARAAQDAMSGIDDLAWLLDFGCVLRMPSEYRTKDADSCKSVEPFYFDARRFANALDTGWSLDVQDSEATAYPAVELLALIGIQRFRPAPLADKGSFRYSVWTKPLGCAVASAVASDAVPLPSSERYRFSLRFRDNQKRYKAFGFANRIGGQ